MRKIYAAATILAKQRGQLPDLPETSHEIAAVIDEGLTKVKVNYLVGKEKIEPEEAINHFIERAETRAIAYVDKAFNSKKVEEYVTNGVVALANFIPKVGRVVAPVVKHYAPVIESVVARVKEPVRNALKTGVHFVAGVAKAGVKKVMETTKEFGKKIVEILSWFS